MATLQKSETVRQAAGSCPDIRHRVCDSGATFKKWDFVRLDSDGELINGPAAGNDWGAGNPDIYGRAETDADPGNKIPVLIPNDQTIFILHYNGTLAETLVGEDHDLRQDSGGFPVVSAATTNAKVHITELIDPVGTVNGRVGVTILPSVRQTE